MAARRTSVASRPKSKNMLETVASQRTGAPRPHDTPFSTLSRAQDPERKQGRQGDG